MTSIDYSIRRDRVTWTRWDATALRNRTSHPTVFIVTEPDGYERTFDRKRDAEAWIAAQA